MLVIPDAGCIKATERNASLKLRLYDAKNAKCRRFLRFGKRHKTHKIKLRLSDTKRKKQTAFRRYKNAKRKLRLSGTKRKTQVKLKRLV